ncbi:MAG: hypothetical protein O3C21_13030 [Verrucomicrobia bacterium]|nr:hypothetical protein [Verrucomicrobiota bacterium]
MEANPGNSPGSVATWQALPGEGCFHTLSIAGDVVWAAGADGRVGISN